MQLGNCTCWNRNFINNCPVSVTLQLGASARYGKAAQQLLISLCWVFSPDSDQFSKANCNLKCQVMYLLKYIHLKISPVGKANALLFGFKDTKERTAFLAGFRERFPHRLGRDQSFKGRKLKFKPTFSPCQGRLPRRKYINMWPRASKSSRRLCSEIEEKTNRGSLAVCSSDTVQKPNRKTHKIDKDQLEGTRFL